MFGREKARAKIDGPAAGRDPAVDHDEVAQIVSLRAQAITEPRARTWSPLLPRAGVQEEVGRVVLGEVADHAPNDAQLVGALADVREQFAHRVSALAVVRELP